MNNAFAPTFTGDDSSVTVFRPTPWFWLPIALYTLIEGTLCGSLVLSAVQNHWSIRDPIIMSVLALGAILPFAVSLAFAQVRVDAETLQWRTWLGWNRVPWRNVLDYFEVSPGDETSKWVRCKVLTPIGPLVFDTGGPMSWTHGPFLRRLIQERATQARANEWGVLGARPDVDWPQTFEEGSSSAPWVLVAGMSVAVIVFIFWVSFKAILALWAPRTTNESILGWAWEIGSASVFILFVVTSVCFVAFLIVNIIIATRQKRQITVSKNGVHYVDSKERIFAHWTDVTRVRNEATHMKALLGDFRTTVETTQGSFTFLCTTRDYYVLKACLRLSVAPSVAEAWRGSHQSEQLWRRVDKIHANTGVYSYRTSGLRLVMCGLTALPIACCVPLLFDFSPETPMRLTLSHGAILPFLFLPALIGWLAYFTTRVVIDDEGVTSQMFFRKKRISWMDVQRVSVNGAEPFRRIRIVGPNTRIGYLSLIADSEHLAAEIQRRTGREPELS